MFSLALTALYFQGDSLGLGKFVRWATIHKVQLPSPTKLTADYLTCARKTLPLKVKPDNHRSEISNLLILSRCCFELSFPRTTFRRHGRARSPQAEAPCCVRLTTLNSNPLYADGKSEIRSCSLCRRRKLRCNRETPCGNCVRSKNATCVYENQPSERTQQRFDEDSAGGPGEVRNPAIERGSSSSRPSTVISHLKSGRSSVAGSTSASTFTGQTSSSEIESLKSRIRDLEDQLSTSAQTNSEHPITLTSSLRSLDSRLFGRSAIVNRAILHKSRLFGQSHWLNGVALVS